LGEPEDPTLFLERYDLLDDRLLRSLGHGNDHHVEEEADRKRDD